MANYKRDHIEVQYSFANDNSTDIIEGILRKIIIEKIISCEIAKARVEFTNT